MNNVPRHAHVIFCDDVRLEVGNKQSFIGSYGPELIVESFPVLVPQLCVLVRVTTPLERPLRSLEVSVSQNGKVLGRFVVPQEQLDIQEESVVRYFGERADSDETSCIAIGAAFHFVPFQLTEPDLIRVIVRADGEILPAQGLRIVGPAPQTEATAPVV
jgi:hypothetical protein